MESKAASFLRSAPEASTSPGIVASARYREIESPRLDVYVPLRQAESFVNHYVVRTAIDPVAVVATLKAETATFDRASR